MDVIDMTEEGDAALRVAGCTLFPFQAHGVQWMLTQEVAPTRLWDQDVPGGLLCDDMGLGKTIQAVAVICRRPLPRTLVVTPVGVLRSWEQILCEAGCDVYELQGKDKVRRIVLKQVPLTAQPRGLQDLVQSGKEPNDEDEDEDPCVTELDAETIVPDEDDTDAEADAEAEHVLELRYAGKVINIESMPPTPTNEDGSAGAPCVVVTTYGTVKPLQHTTRAHEFMGGARPLATIAWDRIVLDEGHVIRNAQTLTALRMSRLVRAPGCAAWVLTGTPVHNRRQDLFAQFSFLGYNMMRIQKTTRDAVTAWQAKAMRRTMADVPSAVRRSMAYPEEDFVVTEHSVAYRSESEAEFYRAATGTIVAQLAALEGYADRREAAQHRFVLMMFLRLLAVHPQIYISACNKQRTDEGMASWPAWTGRVSKNEEVMELVQSWQAEGASFVLFTHFREELLQFKDVLEALGFLVYIIDGSQNGKKRFDMVAASRKAAAEGKQQALLVQIQAGGTGLNVQHLDRVIIPSPDWSVAAESQAIARCHRMGQTRRVQVHRFFLSEVHRAGMQIEQEILRKQTAKNDVIRQIVQSTAQYA